MNWINIHYKRLAIVCQQVDFFIVTANTQRRNLFYFRCICRYLRACLKKAFCKMCVTICGIFCPDEGAVAGYGNWIRVKYPAKWGVQIAGMIFQTHSNVTSIPHIFITHSYYRIKLILTTVSQDNLSISKRRKVILICIINLCYINVNPV